MGGRGRCRNVYPLTGRAPRVEAVTVHVAPGVAHRRVKEWHTRKHEVNNRYTGLISCPRCHKYSFYAGSTLFSMSAASVIFDTPLAAVCSAKSRITHLSSSPIFDLSSLWYAYLSAAS